MTRHYTIDSRKLRLLGTFRNTFGWFIFGQIVGGSIFALIEHKTPMGSLVLTPVLGIAWILTHLFYRKEQRKLANELNKRYVRELREARISSLLTSHSARETFRFQALAAAGVIRIDSLQKDSQEIGIPAWHSPTLEEWAILDFFFTKTDTVAHLLENSPTVASRDRMQAFIHEEAASAYQKLQTLRLAQEAAVDDALWQAKQVIDTTSL